MAQKVDYAALKKGGYMRQKQKGYGSLRLAVVGGNLTAENITRVGTCLSGGAQADALAAQATLLHAGPR